MDARTPSNDQTTDTELVSLTADIVSAYVTNNTVVSGDLPKLIEQTFEALKHADEKNAQPIQDKLTPAVSIKKSVSDDHITCLECGKKFKSIKRHLNTHHNMDPDEYRAKWGLSHDYPMVAPNYSAARAKMAKKIGLGQKRKR